MADPPPRRLTPAEREELKRDERRAEMESQIESGSLTIRKVSDEERAAWEERQAKRPPRKERRR